MDEPDTTEALRRLRAADPADDPDGTWGDSPAHTLARQRLAFMFKDAAHGCRQQIAHPIPSVALEVAFRLVMAGLASYDEMTRTSEGEPLSLDVLCGELIRAVTSYLCGAGARP